MAAGRPSRPDQTPILGLPQGKSPARVDLLVLPGFDLHDLAVITDVFRSADAYAGRRLFEVRILGWGAGPVISSTGIACTVTGAIGAEGSNNTLLLIAGDLDKVGNQEALLEMLIECARKGVQLGGIDGGAMLLTLAGLNRGRVSVSRHRARSLPPGIKDVTFCHSACTFDGETFSCAGGMSTFSLALRAAEEAIGSAAALTVAGRMGYSWGDWHLARTPEIRSPTQVEGSETLQRILRELDGAEPTHENLREALRRAGIGRRQAQRLFRNFIDQTPSQYLQSAQLRRARHLVIRTDLTIEKIAASVGFATGSALGRAYKKAYGKSPCQHRAAYHIAPGPFQSRRGPRRADRQQRVRQSAPDPAQHWPSVKVKREAMMGVEPWHSL